MELIRFATSVWIRVFAEASGRLGSRRVFSGILNGVQMIRFCQVLSNVGFHQGLKNLGV